MRTQLHRSHTNCLLPGVRLFLQVCYTFVVAVVVARSGCCYWTCAMMFSGSLHWVPGVVAPDLQQVLGHEDKVQWEPGWCELHTPSPRSSVDLPYMPYMLVACKRVWDSICLHAAAGFALCKNFSSSRNFLNQNIAFQAKATNQRN